MGLNTDFSVHLSAGVNLGTGYYWSPEANCVVNEYGVRYEPIIVYQNMETGDIVGESAMNSGIYITEYYESVTDV